MNCELVELRKDAIGKNPFYKSRWDWKEHKERLDIIGNTVKTEMRKSNRTEDKEHILNDCREMIDIENNSGDETYL